MVLFWSFLTFGLIPILFFAKKFKTLYFILPSILYLDIFHIFIPPTVYLNNIKVFGIFGFALFIMHILTQKIDFKKNCFFFSVFLSILGIIVVLFLYFNIFFPWEVQDTQRALFYQPLLSGMRSVYVMLSDVGTGYLIYLLIKSDPLKNFKYFLSGFIILVTLGALGILIENFSGIDLFFQFTQGQFRVDALRMRGFFYEPRGASLVLSVLAFFAINVIKSKFLKISLLVLIGLGMTLTYSLLGIVMTAIITPFFVVRSILRKEFSHLLIFFLYVSLTSLLFYFNQSSERNFIHQIQERKFLFTGKTEVLTPPPARELLLLEQKSQEEKVAYIESMTPKISSHPWARRFEVFDGAAVNFLLLNPKYLFFGVGPGNSGVATSPYILEKDKPLWKNRIDSPPLMGIINYLIQFGLVTILLFFSIWIYAFLKMRALKIPALTYFYFLLTLSWCFQGRYFLSTLWFFTFYFVLNFPNAHTFQCLIPWKKNPLKNILVKN